MKYLTSLGCFLAKKLKFEIPKICVDCNCLECEDVLLICSDLNLYLVSFILLHDLVIKSKVTT